MSLSSALIHASTTSSFIGSAGDWTLCAAPASLLRTMPVVSGIQQCLGAFQVESERHIPKALRTNGLAYAARVAVLGKHHKETTATRPNQLPAERAIGPRDLIDSVDA